MIIEKIMKNKMNKIAKKLLKQGKENDREYLKLHKDEIVEKVKIELCLILEEKKEELYRAIKREIAEICFARK